MKKQGYIYALLAVVGWGTNFIACKLVIFGNMDPAGKVLMGTPDDR